MDIGFVALKPSGDDLEAICDAEEPLMLVTSESDPLARTDRISARDFDGVPRILL